MSVEQANELADLVGISTHPNHVITMRAVHKYINHKHQHCGDKKRFNLDMCDIGAAPTSNEKVDNAIRTLRLIHINRLRELQTEINEILSNVQKVTGDPKADLKLGKVGR